VSVLFPPGLVESVEGDEIGWAVVGVGGGDSGALTDGVEVLGGAVGL